MSHISKPYVGKQNPGWKPQPGSLACYTGKSARMLRGGRVLEVVAEATKERMVVRAIGQKGDMVQFTVLACHLGEPQPGLFDLS